MSFSRGAVKLDKNRESFRLVVGWQTHDVGKIGSGVIEFLKQSLGGEEVGEIKPLGFFPLGGAAFEEGLIQFPEGKFWACEETKLLLFKSQEPRYNWYKFLNEVLDFAQCQFRTKELYTVSGTICSMAHTSPRRILTVSNQSEFRKLLQGHGLEDMNWEGPPAISSYLLWVAQRRGIPGASLWPEVPFYLATDEDHQAIRLTLSFLEQRFGLDLDLGGFDFEAKKQNERLARLREQNRDVAKYIGMLEQGLSLGEEEQMKLAREVARFMKSS